MFAEFEVSAANFSKLNFSYTVPFYEDDISLFPFSPINSKRLL